MEDIHPEQVGQLCLCLNGILITAYNNSFSAASLDYLQAELVSHLRSHNTLQKTHENTYHIIVPLVFICLLLPRQ